MRGPRRTAQAPQGMGTFPRLPELMECLEDTTPRDGQGGIVGVSVPGQELDWVIFVGPFPLKRP